ncbi:MAG: hypothetical protein HS101_12780 [Planctomycetia bacterium]|nr:hypothetical protein [Planctomycetia bacterium]
MSKSVSDAFLKCIPQDFLFDLVAAIRAAYPAAQLKASELSPEVQRNVAGTERWGLVESHFFEIASRYELQPEWISNRNNSSQHVELSLNGFVVTISKTEAAGTLPGDADFRLALLATTQLRLFEEDRPEGGFVYAIITHGPTVDPASAGFVEVLFPDRDRQIVERIDLLEFTRKATIANIVAETIQDTSVPVLRRLGKVEGELRR